MLRLSIVGEGWNGIEGSSEGDRETWRGVE